MNKKGYNVTISFVVVVILMLALAISLLLFLKTFFEKTEQAALEKKCEISVKREAAINVATQEAKAAHTAVDFASNIDCRTIPLPIAEKGERARISLTRSYMDRCWEMFGKGKLRLFSRVSDDKRKFCHECYSVSYEPVASFDLKTALDKMLPAFPYDVPSIVSGEKQAIVFYYLLNDDGTTEQKIAVRPFGELDLCADAEFPRQRLT